MPRILSWEAHRDRMVSSVPSGEQSFTRKISYLYCSMVFIFSSISAITWGSVCSER